MGNYWNHTGKYEELHSALRKFVPGSGTVINPTANPELEKFRKASNAYHDIFNNGGGNRDADIKRYFGIRVLDFAKDKEGYNLDWERIYNYTEPAMDKIIMAAVLEQLGKYADFKKPIE